MNTDTIEIYCKNQANEDVQFSIKDINPSANSSTIKTWVTTHIIPLTTNTLVKVLRVVTTEI